MARSRRRLRPRRPLGRRLVDDLGDEKRLHRHPVGGERRLHPLHDKTFMRGMLIDDGDAVARLGDDIGLVKLCPRRAKKRVVKDSVASVPACLGRCRLGWLAAD